MGVKKVESAEQWKEAIGGDKPVVVDFYADWCGPCKAISPLLSKLSDQAEHSGIEFLKVDVDEFTDIAQEHGIRAMPTFIYFKGGEKEHSVTGANPKALNELVAKAKEAAA